MGEYAYVLRSLGWGESFRYWQRMHLLKITPNYGHDSVLSSKILRIKMAVIGHFLNR